MTLFRNKYRVESARLKGYDYSSPGFYFVTICTKNREHFFGEIKNNVMNFSNMGQIATKFWREIVDHFPHVKLDEFIIMPNHLHGIIQIYHDGRDAINRVSTDLKIENPSLSKIIRWYKGRSTFEIRKSICHDFAWQSRFHDHIVRNEQSLNQIRLYIQQNPFHW
ncbi:MAG TPA: hypothetical protein PLY93_06675, partial [Turneriella sp.]|nr:hypothetical protein [Turneriella sp.]